MRAALEVEDNRNMTVRDVLDVRISKMVGTKRDPLPHQMTLRVNKPTFIEPKSLHILSITGEVHLTINHFLSYPEP